MNQNILLAFAVFVLFCSTLSSGILSVFGAINLDVEKDDEIIVQSTIAPDEYLEEFVYIVQVEDEERHVVFLEFRNGVTQSASQVIFISWQPDNEGTYSVKTFVWSDLENPVQLDYLVSEKRIDVNEKTEVLCSGSAACFTDVVTKIVDGDTLDVGDTRIRLSLVNTPEIGEQGYEEASNFAASLCPVGSRVVVDQDDLQLVDDYGRMLATVMCQGNKVLNAELLESNHAELFIEYCDDSEFSSAPWIQGGCETGAIPPPQEEIPPEEEQSCDPAYPDVCIPPPPPDLDCGEISYRNFRVLSPDPHRFDGDNDGIGCES